MAPLRAYLYTSLLVCFLHCQFLSATPSPSALAQVSQLQERSGVETRRGLANPPTLLYANIPRSQDGRITAFPRADIHSLVARADPLGLFGARGTGGADGIGGGGGGGGGELQKRECPAGRSLCNDGVGCCPSGGTCCSDGGGCCVREMFKHLERNVVSSLMLSNTFLPFPFFFFFSSSSFFLPLYSHSFRSSFFLFWSFFFSVPLSFTQFGGQSCVMIQGFAGCCREFILFYFILFLFIFYCLAHAYHTLSRSERISETRDDGLY